MTNPPPHKFPQGPTQAATAYLRTLLAIARRDGLAVTAELIELTIEKIRNEVF